MFFSDKQARAMAAQAADNAREAANRMESHEKVCTQRWEEAQRIWQGAAQSVQDVKHALSATNKLIISILVTVAGSAIVALAFVLFRALEHAGVM